MSAVAFDSLEYAHQLEAVGMPREQAEVVAKGVTKMFIHNFDTLVTRDYLDTRFTEFETRIEAKMDRRFAGMAAHFDQRMSELAGDSERRFAELARDTDRRFAGMAGDIDRRFAAVDVRFERIEGRLNLVYWIQGLTLACVVVPLLRSFLG